MPKSLQSAPAPVKAAFSRIKDFKEIPWLKQPVYYRFFEAMKPNPHLDTFGPYQLGIWHYAYRGADLLNDYAPVAAALAYWNSDLIRTHLNALFFGGASVAEVVTAMKLEQLSVDAYKRLFCEISVFGGAPLLLMEYVHGLPELRDSDKKEKTLYRMAIDFGWRWVVWKVTRGTRGHIPGVQVIDTMTSLAFWRALEASASPINSDNAREGRQYMKLAADLAMSKHRSRMGEINSIRDLALKLMAVDADTYEDEHYGEAAPFVNDLLYADPNKED